MTRGEYVLFPGRKPSFCGGARLSEAQRFFRKRGSPAFPRQRRNLCPPGTQSWASGSPTCGLLSPSTPFCEVGGDKPPWASVSSLQSACHSPSPGPTSLYPHPHGPNPPRPTPTLLICLSLKPVYDSLEEADGRVDRKEKALALHRSGLESPMVSQLRLDLEQASFPLCFGFLSGDRNTRLRAWKLSSLLIHFLPVLLSWGRSRPGRGTGAKGILAPGQPGQQIFLLKRKRMKGKAVLIDTYYVSGIQQHLFYRLREGKLLVQGHTANKRDSDSHLGPSGSQFMA